MFEKLFAKRPNESKDEPWIVESKNKRAVKKYGGSKKLIAPVNTYAEIMRMIPEGKLITKDNIREYLAKKYNADFTDPLTSEIYVNLVAIESVENKIEEVPFWRTLDRDGGLNDKFPGGIENQKSLLEKEGHTILEKGNSYYVINFEKKIFKFSEND